MMTKKKSVDFDECIGNMPNKTTEKMISTIDRWKIKIFDSNQTNYTWISLDQDLQSTEKQY